MSKETKNRIVPKLRFPEFKNNEQWEEKPLSKVCEVNPSVEKLPEQFVYIDLESVEDGKLLQKKIIQATQAPSRAQRLLKAGDVIFQMVRPYQKNNYLFWQTDNLNYVASTGYAQLRAYESEIYLYQYLHNQNFVDKVLAKSTGSNYPAINPSALSEILIGIPKFEEQQKIASCLSSLDDLITAENNKFEALKAHKKGLMQKLFPAEGKKVPELRFEEFKENGEWEEKKFDQLCKFTRGPFGGALKKEIFVSNGYAVYEQSHAIYNDFNSFRYYITKEKFQELKRFSVHPEDIIMSCSGTMGKFSIIPKEPKEGVINQALLKLSVKKGYDVKFILATLEFPETQNKLLSQSAGGAIKNVVGVAQIKEIPIYVPSISEQQKIANCLSSLDELITAQTEKIEALKEHKKGLMQGLFPGVSEM